MFAENYFDVITGGYECVYNFHPFVYILLWFVNASVVRDTFWTAKYDKGMTTWSYLSIVTQAMVLHIPNVGNYHQFTKVARHYSVDICEAFSSIFPNDVWEVLKQGIEMMKQKLI